MDPLIAPLFERAERTPGRVLCRSPRRGATTGEVAARAREVAEHARELSLGSGAIVGLVATSGPRFLAAYAGLRLAGVAVLLIDSATPPEEARRAADRLGAAALWHEPDAWATSPGANVEPLDHRASPPPGTAAIKLTSGSTGAPSGIAVSAEGLLADAEAIRTSMGLTPEDRFLSVIPLSHSYGFSVLASPALLLGAELVFADGDEPLDAAAELGATVLPSVPAWFRAVADVTEAEAWPSSLRLLVSAGAPLPPETAALFRERYDAPIHAFYGSSECGGISYDRRGDAAERGSVGTPMDGATVELVEPDANGGIVRVTSRAVALGYVGGAPASTSRLGGGRFRTEDVAEFVEDELFLRGRRSDWINVKGKKVNPREVESVIGELDGVREVVVLAQPVPGDDRQVIRSVIASPEGGVSWRDVVDWCRPRLAPHKIPRSVVVVPSIPRTARGKIDRRALLELAPTAPTGSRPR